MTPSKRSSASTVLSASPLSIAVIVGAGLLLVWCSYLFEVHAVAVLLRDFGLTYMLERYDFVLAQGLAAGLNAGKVSLSLIIAHRIVARRNTLVPQFGRLLVFSLSLSLVLVVFGDETVSPNARAVYDARLAEVDQTQRNVLADLNAQFDARVQQITTTIAANREELETATRARILDLEAQLDRERGIGGQNFRGARYIEIERQLEEVRADRDQALDALRIEERDALAALAAERTAAQARIRADGAEAREGIDLATITGSSEAQHPAVVAFSRIVATLGGLESVNPVFITVGLSLLMTFALELLPMVLLTHAFRALGEARVAENEERLEQERQQAASDPAGEERLSPKFRIAAE